jgi:KTSC domain
MKVDSSHLRSADYMPESKTLAVEFTNGHTYHYYLVPPSTWEAFQKAESKGTFLNRHVKPKHAARRVNPPAKGRK